MAVTLLDRGRDKKACSRANTVFRSVDVHLRFRHEQLRTNRETEERSALNECPEEPHRGLVDATTCYRQWLTTPSPSLCWLSTQAGSFFQVGVFTPSLLGSHLGDVVIKQTTHLVSCTAKQSKFLGRWAHVCGISHYWHNVDHLGVKACCFTIV